MNKIALMPQQEVATVGNFSNKQIDILKNSICKGVTNEEFEIFLMACTKTQLDPFMRQIYAVKRGSTMTIQTGIDGYRLIAERTGCYAPGPEPTYVYDSEGRLQSATAYIKKQTRDGTWHTISASAYLDEYCQRTKEGYPMGMWRNMARTMLFECAEAQALRKAFPAEMSGIYTKEEMEQADSPRISLDQAAELENILEHCDDKYKTLFKRALIKLCKSDDICDLPLEMFEKVKEAAVKNAEENAVNKETFVENESGVEL